MLGRELLMALAQRKRLRGLDEPARTVGVFLDIHASLPRAQTAAPGRRTSPERPPLQDVRSTLASEKGEPFHFDQRFQGCRRTVNKMRLGPFMTSHFAKIR